MPHIRANSFPSPLSTPVSSSEEILGGWPVAPPFTGADEEDEPVVPVQQPEQPMMAEAEPSPSPLPPYQQDPPMRAFQDAFSPPVYFDAPPPPHHAPFFPPQGYYLPHQHQQQPPFYGFLPQPAAFLSLAPPPHHAQPSYYQQQVSGNWKHTSSSMPQPQQQLAAQVYQQPVPSPLPSRVSPPRAANISSVFPPGSVFANRCPVAEVQRLLSRDTVQSWGKVLFFCVNKGYGMIVDAYADQLGREVFIHHSGIEQGKGFRCLSEGEYVEYTLTKSANGWQALAPTGSNGAPVIGLNDPQVDAAVKKAHLDRYASVDPCTPSPTSSRSPSPYGRRRPPIAPRVLTGCRVNAGRIYWG
ncbi:hypothetical protein JCM8547_002679 [Rhodosporidiobolus lusitaniae]